MAPSLGRLAAPRSTGVGPLSALVLASLLALILASTALATGPVVHHVSAGGPDACLAIGFPHPGCDGNYSFVADEYADGSVMGRYVDRFAQGNGFSAVIDCLSIVGNEAWVSGVITSGSGFASDWTGLRLSTRVRDNGTSANDPADQIGVSIIDGVNGDATLCTEHATNDRFFDTPQGQVTVG
jgi:hypothetical protein